MADDADVVRFYQGERRRGTWCFYGHRGGDRVLASALVGRTVNIGTKDGLVYDSARVTGFDERRGLLTVEGGMKQAYVGEPRATVRDEVRVDDVARGFIHNESGRLAS